NDRSPGNKHMGLRNFIGTLNGIFVSFALATLKVAIQIFPTSQSFAGAPHERKSTPADRRLSALTATIPYCLLVYFKEFMQYWSQLRAKERDVMIMQQLQTAVVTHAAASDLLDHSVVVPAAPLLLDADNL